MAVIVGLFFHDLSGVKQNLHAGLNKSVQWLEKDKNTEMQDLPRVPSPSSCTYVGCVSAESVGVTV